MTSAFSNVAASLGFGSNVCELVPSGTIPVIVAPEPPAIFATMLVIGATVVAMLSTRLTDVPDVQPSGEIVVSASGEEVPHAVIVAMSANIPIHRRIKIIE